MFSGADTQLQSRFVPADAVVEIIETCGIAVLCAYICICLSEYEQSSGIGGRMGIAGHSVTGGSTVGIWYVRLSLIHI